MAIDEPPIVVLVSVDGWRWDYTERARVPNLNALAAQRVRAKGLIPSFPSKTFPNYCTIVTGLYPDHHGSSPM
jgi:predicted AlkP superfamily pyrophosphatase or phosphodiesterase